jgi:hypothetical protein
MRKLYHGTLFLLVGGFCFAQEPVPITQIPGAIDGAKTPELIPDAIAYRLFFEAIAEPPSATTAQLRRQRMKLLQARLEEDDLNVIASVMADFHHKLEQFKADYAFAHEPGTTGQLSVDIEAWRSRRDEIVDGAHASLRQQMTPLGLKRLDDYIQTRKRQMVIFPPPDMQHGGH